VHKGSPLNKPSQEVVSARPIRHGDLFESADHDGIESTVRQSKHRKSAGATNRFTLCPSVFREAFKMTRANGL